jgi:hypothetical protein
MTKAINRDEVEQRLRKAFEANLSERIDEELYFTRNEREEALAEQIEECMRDEFEDGLSERIEDELDSTRYEREEALAEQIEERLRDEFEDEIADLDDEIEALENA